MLTFTSQHSITAVNRLSYSGSPSKGTLSPTGNTYTGYLRPLSAEEVAVNQMQWGVGFRLITEVGVDIRVGDVLTIDGATYQVRGRADHTRGFAAQYLQFLLQKPEA